MIDRIPPLNSSDRLVDYLARFEELMKDAEVEEKVWDKHLVPTGKALAAYGRDIPDNVKGQYHTLKEALLNVMGLSRRQCSKDFLQEDKSAPMTWMEAG